MIDDKQLVRIVAEDVGHDHSALAEIIGLINQHAARRARARQRRAIAGVAAAVAVLGAGISIASSHAPVESTTLASAPPVEANVSTSALDRATSGVKVIPKSARCFARQSADPSESVSVGIALKVGHPAPRVADYVAVCGELWKKGELLANPPYVAGSAGGATDPAVGVAPRLLPCLGTNDELLVVPGSAATTCTRLGLAVASD